jgi:hypothetical protein
MNAEDAKLIQEFKARMGRIAKKNRDAFTTTITVDEKGYRVEVVESAESHAFTDGKGATIAECLADAVAGLDDVLAQWGYKDAA